MPEIPFAVQWTIPEYQLLAIKDSDNGYLTSTFVSNIPELAYFIRIFPNGGREEHRGQTWIMLCLNIKKITQVDADFTVAIESANYSEAINCVYEKSSYCRYSICDTKEFFDSENKFIVDGKFTVKINGIFKVESVTDTPGIKQQKCIGGEIGNELWEREDTKDFTVVTKDGKEIKAHKFIISHRSEVFAAMLNSNMKESEEIKVELPDFPFAVVEVALKLIYHCECVTSLSLDDLMLLLQFFDKYQIPNLKGKVEQYLIGQIAAATVCNLTNAAILTNSYELKGKCMEFLSAAFESKTPLHDIDSLDKDVALQLLKNSLYQIVEVKEK